jgi:uncharacterized protein YkwD
MLRHLRRRTVVLVLATTAALAPCALAPVSAVGGRSSAGVDRVERALIHKINLFRRHHGLRPMRISGRMSTGADQHSRSMARGRYMGHGSGWAARARRYSHARHVGEVVDYAYRVSPSRQAHHVLSDWVHSSGHRSVGRARSGSYVFFTVDVAGRK